MRRPFVVVALVAVALAGCGGDEVKFNLKSPPPWLKKLDSSLPAKAMQPGELSGNCVGRQFAGECSADVRASKSMTRKAKFRLEQGLKVRITYTPNEEANEVTVTATRREPEVTLPVRRSGGKLTFRCASPLEPCAISMQ